MRKQLEFKMKNTPKRFERKFKLVKIEKEIEPNRKEDKEAKIESMLDVQDGSHMEGQSVAQLFQFLSRAATCNGHNFQPECC